MHIIAGIIAILTTAIIWWWRMRNASNAAIDVIDAANDTRLFVRRLGWRRKRGNPIDAINDPRQAAAGILVLAAQVDGAISQAEQGMILTSFTKHFACNAAEAEEFMAFGRWIIGYGKTLDECQRRLLKKIKELGGAEALADLSGMVEAVGKADTGQVSAPVSEIVRQIKILAAR